MSDRLVVCVDFGSTFTKAALVDVEAGRLVATAEHPTTLHTDVLEGFEACLDRLAATDAAARQARVLACSSAGGGLRIGVVGNETLVTAEAGRRVALSSGGRVVHVSSGGLSDVASLAASRPDVLLLVGGTDGGNSAVLLACARTLAEARWDGPVVVAGNVEARDQVSALLGASGTPHVLADNVVPSIGVLAPDSARGAIRRIFVEHVIGGKHLSARPDFAEMVVGATPDIVLTAVDLLSRGLDDDRPGVGDVVVVDVGGATTDVYSAVEPLESESGPARDVVGWAPVNRTVEGDLGMRWSAPSTVEAATAAGLLDGRVADEARSAARVRQADPAHLPTSPADAAFDVQLSGLAAGLALRRHAGRAQVRFEYAADGGTRIVERSGVDLRETALLVGSGGVLRHTGSAEHLLDHVSTDGGWQVPESPRVVVDVDYVLAPAGLLAGHHPEAAYRLLARLR